MASTQAIDRIRELEIEMNTLKQQHKAEKAAAKVQSQWVNIKKRMPEGEAGRVLAWADGHVERVWHKDGKFYVFDGTFFLTDKDKLDHVEFWMQRDWMYTRTWPKYGPGFKNRLRYYWQIFIYGAQDMAYDLRPKGWGSKAQLGKKPTFYQDSAGRLMTGLPEFMPAPQGFQKIVCNNVREAERYSSIQRQQEGYEHRSSMEQRAAIEGQMHEQIRSERRTLIANARNNLNRDFLIAANERADKQGKPWEYQRESYLHSEAHEDGH